MPVTVFVFVIVFVMVFLESEMHVAQTATDCNSLPLSGSCIYSGLNEAISGVDRFGLQWSNMPQKTYICH